METFIYKVLLVVSLIGMSIVYMPLIVVASH